MRKNGARITDKEMCNIMTVPGPGDDGAHVLEAFVRLFEMPKTETCLETKPTYRQSFKISTQSTLKT
jgi:hypothetical protein